MVAEIAIQRNRIESDRVDRGTARQWRFGAIAQPAREGDLGGARFATELAGTIIQGGQCGTSGEEVGQAPASGAIGSFRRVDLGRRCAALLGDDRRHRFGVVAIKPRDGGVALNRGYGDALFGGGLFRLALETFGARLALFGPGELLHDAHAAHGHEVSRQAEAILAIDRQIVDSQFGDRIGKLRRRHRHFARGIDSGVLRNQHS